MQRLDAPRCRRRSSLILATAAAAAIGALLPNRAQAINITMTFNAGASQNPAGDPAGANLQAIMTQVESVYQDIFEDAHNITINFWYEPQGAGILAAHSLVSQAGGREIEGNIRFDPTAQGSTWFFDPTPEDNSEFTMSQTLWRDLSAANRTNFYNSAGTIPDTFEAAFTGTNNSSNPNVAGNTDLLSVAFHEVGHSLGMSASNTTTVTETGDGDYDYDSVNVFGATLAAKNASGGNVAHLASNAALMTPAIGTAIRRLPSHTDLFSMAAVHNYSLLDVPRREYYAGSSDWNTDANWAGNTVPGSADEVFVRDNNGTLSGTTVTATLSATGFAANLHISEAANVNTSTFLLSVGTVTVDGLDSDLIVTGGGTLSATGLINQNDAQVLMTGGVINATNITNSASEIQGRGTINFSGSFTNNGSIQVSGGSLTINATGAASLNLDGSSGTILFSEPGDFQVLSNSSLSINSPLTDNFNGTGTIGNTATAAFNEAWTLGGGSGGTIILSSDGVINLNGGTTSITAATLGGTGVATIQGDINVGTTNFGIISAPVVFSADNGGAEVVDNGTLQLTNNGTFAGGSFTGAGTLILDGLQYTVTGNTTIGVANLDLDGLGVVGSFTVNNGVTATINSTIFDAESGTITVLGNLVVNSPAPWATDVGSIILNSGTVSGTAPVSIGGDVLAIAGSNAINSDATFTSTSTISVTPAAVSLSLGGNTTFSGGTSSGLGTLRFDGPTQTFVANTTIGVATLDMDGVITGNIINVNSGVTATIASNISSDPFDSTINVTSGTFAVTGGGSWTNSGEINLTGTGRLTGVLLVNDTDGTIQGTGTIATADLINNGTISARSNGTLNIACTSFPDLDGTSVPETGVLNATAGNLHIFGNFGNLFGYNSTINIGGGHFFVMANQGIANFGSINFTGGGTYSAPGFTQNGTLTVTGGVGFLSAGTYAFSNAGASNTALALNLVLDGNGTINSGAVFTSTGGGLVVPGTGVCNLNAADVGVGFQNQGLLQTVAGANHVLSIIGTGVTTVAAGTSLDVGSGGPVTQATFNVNGSADVGSVNVSGATNIGPAGNLQAFYVRAATLNIAGGGIAGVKTNGTNSGVSRLNTLTIAGGGVPTGRMNLRDNDLIIDYAGASPIVTTFQQIRAGYNGGPWTGQGITSSTAAGLTTTGLGYAEASQLGLAVFDGQAIDATTVLVKYTWYGDANLDGQVDVTDLGALATGWQTAQPWIGGDFDYSGFVDVTDLGRLATNWQAGVGSPLGRTSFGEALAAVGLGGISVPEPGTAAAIVGLLLGTTLAGRNRRRP